jgi:hypothetical protein
MPDLVFVRANPNMPVKEGRAVTTIPSALPGTGSIYDVAMQGGALETANGQAGFAQAVLAGKNRHIGYYEGFADPADNPAQPTF